MGVQIRISQSLDIKYKNKIKYQLCAKMSMYEKIMSEGIPESWTNTMDMQNQFPTAQAKGWQVDMRWGKSEHLAKIGMKSTGAYVMEDVKKGQVLRKGEVGKNLILATKMEDFPKLTETTKYYISNYCATSNSASEGNQEVYLWLPGNSRNHTTENPNCESVKKPHGYDIVATRDIAKGEELLTNYTGFGTPPSWFATWIKDNKVDSVFKGLNDFV